jgi:hypothetical protein
MTRNSLFAALGVRAAAERICLRAATDQLEAALRQLRASIGAGHIEASGHDHADDGQL